MNSYGLGLILEFVDNGSAGMSKANQVFQDLAATSDVLVGKMGQGVSSINALNIAGMSLSQAGSTISGVGNTIVGTMETAVESIINVGSEILSTKISLDALFKSAEEGDKVFDWVLNYAKKSPFNVQDLLPMVTMMKAVDIDIRDSIASSAGNVTDIATLASDLAMIFPNIKNSYGSGVSAMMGAIKEYVSSEANALTFKRGTGIDIAGMLGEKKGATTEDRMTQIADIAESVGAFGMTNKYLGTTSQILSNLDDLWQQFIMKIAESGKVFDTFGVLLNKIADYLFAITDEELNNMAKVIGQAISSLLSLLDKVIDKLIIVADYVRGVFKNNPQLVDFIIKFAAWGGVITLVSGNVLKLVGTVLSLIASFAIIKSTFPSFFSSLFVAIIKGFGSFALSILPLVGLAYLFKTAWDSNLNGFRDKVTSTFKFIVEAAGIVWDAFVDNTLVEDKFNRAKELGILPFIETLLDLKANIGNFATGFVQGIQIVVQNVLDLINKVIERLTPFKKNLDSTISTVGEFIKSITGFEVSKDWEKTGEIAGQIFGYFIVLLPIIKVIMLIVKGVSILVNVITFIWPAIAAIAGALATPIGLIIAGVILVTALIIIFRKQIAEFFISIGEALRKPIEAIKNFFIGMWKAIVDFFTPIGEWFSNTFTPMFQMLGDRLTDFVGKMKEIGASFMNFMRGIGEKIRGWFSHIWESVGKSFVEQISKLGKNLGEVFTRLGKAIWGYITDMMNNVLIVVKFAVKWIVKIFTAVGGFLYDYVIAPMIDNFKNVILPVIMWVVGIVVDAFGVLFEAIGGVITGIIEWFNGLIDFILGVFTGDWSRAWEGIKEIFHGVFMALESIAKVVVNAIILVINGIISGLNLIQIPDWVPGIGGVGINIPEIPYLSTGGEITKEGTAVVHPAEVVVNSDTTELLKRFLTYQYKNKGAEKRDTSVVIQNFNVNVESASDRDLETIADRLTEIIERKKELKKYSVRTPVFNR